MWRNPTKKPRLWHQWLCLMASVSTVPGEKWHQNSEGSTSTIRSQDMKIFLLQFYSVKEEEMCLKPSYTSMSTVLVFVLLKVSSFYSKNVWTVMHCAYCTEQNARQCIHICALATLLDVVQKYLLLHNCVHFIRKKCRKWKLNNDILNVFTVR